MENRKDGRWVDRVNALPLFVALTAGGAAIGAAVGGTIGVAGVSDPILSLGRLVGAGTGAVGGVAAGSLAFAWILIAVAVKERLS